MTIKSNLQQYTCDKCGKTEIMDANSNSEFKWYRRRYLGKSQEEQAYDLCAQCIELYNKFMPTLDEQFEKFILNEQ